MDSHPEVTSLRRGVCRTCSDPRKLDRLTLEFSATSPGLGEERNRMKASKFSDALKAFIIKQGEEGAPVAEICAMNRAGFAGG